MSFSDDVKRELLGSKLKGNCCRRAFLFGALMGGELKGDKVILKISNTDTAQYVKECITHVLKQPYEEKCINRGFCRMTVLSFTSPAGSRFLASCDEVNEDGIPEGIDSYIKCAGCTTAFMRGVFCACGSISDPKKSITLEMILPTLPRAEATRQRLLECDLMPGLCERKTGYGLFFRNGEAVTSFLTICGANEMVFDLYNVQIEREIRNYENRATNCVAVNIQKSVDAAARQVSIIARLYDIDVFYDMPADLQYTGNLRIQHPEMSLSELAEAHKPAISKSGLNNRLRKIAQYAKTYGIE